MCRATRLRRRLVQGEAQDQGLRRQDLVVHRHAVRRRRPSATCRRCGHDRRCPGGLGGGRGGRSMSRRHVARRRLRALDGGGDGEDPDTGGAARHGGGGGRTPWSRRMLRWYWTRASRTRICETPNSRATRDIERCLRNRSCIAACCGVTNVRLVTGELRVDEARPHCRANPARGPHQPNASAHATGNMPVTTRRE